MTMLDVLDHAPFADDDTAALVTGAVGDLAELRDLHHPNPAVRLHLLASLHQETRHQLLKAILDARDHHYSATQIAVLLHL